MSSNERRGVATTLPMLLMMLAAMAPSHAEPASPTTIRLSEEQVRTAGIRVEPATATIGTQAQGAASLHLSGRVTLPGAGARTVLSTLAGQVEAQYAQGGAAVHRGQPLLRIESPGLATLQREYLNARAARKLAEARRARDQALYEDGIIAQARLEETRAAYEMNLASEQESQRALALAGFSGAALDSLTPKTLSTGLTIAAPMDGILVEQPLQPGQRFETGTVLARIARAGNWWIDLQASSDQAAQIATGDIVEVPGCARAGSIVAVGAQLDPSSQTVLVRAEVPQATECLRPNQYLQVGVAPREEGGRILRVPASALIRQGMRHFVFVQEPGGYRPVEVTVARRTLQWAAISGGIQAGAPVATSGTTMLRGAWLGLGTESTGVP